MNTRRKKSGARLLVCGSLLGSIALIGLYHPSGSTNNSSTTASSTDALSPDGYYSGPMHKASVEDQYKIMHPAVADWQTEVPVLQKKMTLHLADSKISNAIAVLARTTGLNFVYPDTESSNRLSIDQTNVPVWQVMQILADTCGGAWQHDHNLFRLRLMPTGQNVNNPKLQIMPA